MANNVDFLNGLLYRGTTTPLEFEWDMLMPDVPILQLISSEDIQYLKDIITSPRYAGNSKLRISKIDEVMNFRGFTKFAGGTNRLVYTHLAAPNMVFKVAVDAIGIEDNPAEYYNQRFLKPYCTKVFECSPCGTIASFQKVDRITTFDEFYSMLDDYYRLVKYNIIGKYVMEDIGMDYFMNFGTWVGHGLVILDFPYLYELDGAKLYCNSTLEDGTKCHGEIDYTPGFNKLICTKCGRTYRARDLAKSPENGGILLRRKGAVKMKFSLKRGDKVVQTFDTNKEVEFLSKEKPSMPTDRNSIRPVKLVKKTVIIKKEQPTIKKTVSDNKTIKHIDTSTSQEKKDNKKIVVKTVNVETEKKDVKKSSEPTFKKVTLRTVKKAIKHTDLPIVPKRTKYISTKKVDNKNNSKVEHNTPSSTVVKRVINVSVGKPSTSNSSINTDKKDGGIEVNLVKVKKPVTVSTSVVKRLSKGSVIKNEKKLDDKDNIKKEVKILDIGDINKAKSLEEEKKEIIENSGIEEVSKEIVETYNEVADTVEETNDVVVEVNNETTNPVEEPAVEISNTGMYDVHFVGALPTNVEQYDPDDYSLFALYIGTDDFEDHTELMEYPVYVDPNEYKLYALYDGVFYPTDGYDENGTIILLTDDYYEDEEEYAEQTDEEATDDRVNESSDDITEDDIINELKKSGKPSVEDLL